MDWLLSPKRKCLTEDRRWEDLNRDCLVKVFEKVGTESMLLAIPFVCKSWYTTSLDPACWKRLIFPDTAEKGTIDDPWSSQLGPWDYHNETESSRFEYFIDPWSSLVDFWDYHNETESSSFEYFIDPWSSQVDPWDYHNETESSRFDYFTRRFAREYGLKWGHFRVPKFINNVINRSKGEAQFLKLPGICSYYTIAVREILSHVNKNCSKFWGLHLSNASINEHETSAIVEFVPNVKYLCLRKSHISRKNLVKILKGCRELEVLDVRECRGFYEGDKKLLELASHIPKFMCAGSEYSSNFMNAPPLIDIHGEEDLYLGYDNVWNDLDLGWNDLDLGYDVWNDLDFGYNVWDDEGFFLFWPADW